MVMYLRIQNNLKNRSHKQECNCAKMLFTNYLGKLEDVDYEFCEKLEEDYSKNKVGVYF